MVFHLKELCSLSRVVATDYLVDALDNDYIALLLGMPVEFITLS